MNSSASEVAIRELLVFLVAERFFALDLEAVVQIIGYLKPTMPPKKRSYIEGIIEFRGDFLPLMSLGKRLGLEESNAPMKPVIVVLRLGGETMGLVVDSVVRVISQDLEAVTEPPPKLQGVKAEYLQGVFNLSGKPLLWINDESLVAPKGEMPLIKDH